MELPHAGITLSDPVDVQVYRDLFARWHAAAIHGEPALEFLQHVARELREDRQATS
jgi:hypothetical protein